MKYCNACKKFKQESEFYVRRDTGGRMSDCKKCSSRKCIARQRKRYELNPQIKHDALTRVKTWCELNPGKSKASMLRGALRYQKAQSDRITEKYARHSLVCWMGANHYSSEMVKAQQARIQLHRSLNEK